MFYQLLKIKMPYTKWIPNVLSKVMVLQELMCNAYCLFYSYWYWNILVSNLRQITKFTVYMENLRQITKFTVYMEHKITVSLAHFKLLHIKPNYLWAKLTKKTFIGEVHNLQKISSSDQFELRKCLPYRI